MPSPMLNTTRCGIVADRRRNCANFRRSQAGARCARIALEASSGRAPCWRERGRPSVLTMSNTNRDLLAWEFSAARAAHKKAGLCGRLPFGGARTPRATWRPSRATSAEASRFALQRTDAELLGSMHHNCFPSTSATSTSAMVSPTPISRDRATEHPLHGARTRCVSCNAHKFEDLARGRCSGTPAVPNRPLRARRRAALHAARSCSSRCFEPHYIV